MAVALEVVALVVELLSLVVVPALAHSTTGSAPAPCRVRRRRSRVRLRASSCAVQGGFGRTCAGMSCKCLTVARISNSVSVSRLLRRRCTLIDAGRRGLCRRHISALSLRLGARSRAACVLVTMLCAIGSPALEVNGEAYERSVRELKAHAACACGGSVGKEGLQLAARRAAAKHGRAGRSSRRTAGRSVDHLTAC